MFKFSQTTLLKVTTPAVIPPEGTSAQHPYTVTFSSETPLRTPIDVRNPVGKSAMFRPVQDMNEKMINEKRPLTDIINNESVSNSSVSPVVPDNSVKQPETKMPPKEMQYNYFSAVNNAEQQAERKETAKPIQKPAEKSIADSLQDVIKAESESDEFTGIPARKSKDEGFTIKAAPDEEVIITISIKRIKINAGK